jgi:hypothetical protein
MKRTLAGIAAFVVTLGVAYFATRYYAAPPAPVAAPAPPPPAAAPPPAPDAGAPELITHRARLVTLDFAAAKSHATLALERDPARPAPERVWVRTDLYTKDASAPRGFRACMGRPVEVRQPFSAGSRPVVNVSAPVEKCAEPADPAATFYARVQVFAAPPDPARGSEPPDGYDITTGVPVVLQRGARKRP